MRLIDLAKDARHYDLELDSTSDREWKFVASVCKLNRHPMSWLLRWAGIREQKSWWDRSLLIISAIFLAFCFVAVMVLGIVETWPRLGWIAAGLGYFVVLLFLYFASRHIGDWQLRREIDKYHRVATTTHQLS
jgi:uncharacterized membrane protein YqjE